MDLRKFSIWDTLYHHKGDIVKFERPIKETSQFIWGKEARIPTLPLNPNSPYKEEIYELETWHVKVPFVEDIFEFVPACRKALEDFMKDKVSEKEVDSSKWNQYTCHQLCDWNYLTDETGNVLIDLNNCITFVKYGVVVKTCDNEEEEYIQN